MIDPKKRDMATSFTAFLFLAVGVSGVFMFFHLFDDYTKIMHEILGLAFVLASSFHIMLNWNQMRKYFHKKIFAISGVLIFVASTIFIFINKDFRGKKDTIIESLLHAPISNSFVVLNKDFKQTKAKIEEKGIVVGGSNTIEEIGKNNGISSHRVLEVIIR